MMFDIECSCCLGDGDWLSFGDFGLQPSRLMPDLPDSTRCSAFDPNRTKSLADISAIEFGLHIDDASDLVMKD